MAKRFNVGDKIRTLPAIDIGWELYDVKPLANLIGVVVTSAYEYEPEYDGMWPYSIELDGMGDVSYLVDETEIELLTEEN